MRACHFNLSDTSLIIFHATFLLSYKHTDLFGDQLKVGKENQLTQIPVSLTYFSYNQPECMLRNHIVSIFTVKKNKKIKKSYIVFAMISKQSSDYQGDK